MSEESDADRAPRYWFNTRTGRVEEGRQSAWTELMGPYDTAEEAARALDSARRRTDAWDDDDDRWRGTEKT
ncbi:SPOR domain-containing protein [Xylanimonas protaetiae]|uniref:SPOR domain-containing protein n=1 Tax=Xylanimonas protaetiae TaxID=2509457 RepID=A0A4P6FL30_9MICO|nr:SPOR domain-containing protein [Xylanimonas protaetiae]QAY71348.1 SPOR domain-containing protein [Xylanimonas protaetiae]